MQKIFWLLLIVSAIPGCAAVATPEVAMDQKPTDRMLLADRATIVGACRDAQSTGGSIVSSYRPKALTDLKPEIDFGCQGQSAILGCYAYREIE